MCLSTSFCTLSLLLSRSLSLSLCHSLSLSLTHTHTHQGPRKTPKHSSYQCFQLHPSVITKDSVIPGYLRTLATTPTSHLSPHLASYPHLLTSSPHSHLLTSLPPHSHL